MAKQLQLTIPTPCHENWEDMTPVEKGRFCDSCKKQVIDFSSMNDRQVAEFFKKPSRGSVCGRFMPDQLDRNIDIPKKRIPWVKYFFQFALPAFLLSMKSSPVKAQGKLIIKEMDKPVTGDTIIMDEVVVTTKLKNLQPRSLYNSGLETLRGKVGFCFTAERKEEPVSISAVRNLSVPSVNSISFPAKEVRDKDGIQSDSISRISGKITDQKGNPLGFAAVVIKGTKIAVPGNEDGAFIIQPSKSWEKATLVISSVGFRTKEILIEKNNYCKEVVIVMEFDEVFLAGEVVITKSFSKKQKQGIPVIPDLPVYGSKKGFSIFPNPAISGSELIIESKQLEEGYYTMQFLNQSGQLAKQQELWIDAEARLLNIEVPSVAPGTYFLVLINKKAGKKFTEKIIIQ